MVNKAQLLSFTSALFFIFLLGSPAAYAQNAAGISIGFHYGLAGMKNNELNTFVNSFNTYYEVDMKKPFSEYDMFAHREWGISLGYRKAGKGLNFAASYQFNYASSTNSTIIWNNSGYDLNVAYYTHDFQFILGYGFTSWFNLNGYLGVPMRFGNHTMWKVYQDGSRSLGYEYDINGFYEGFLGGFDLGAELGFRVWKFYFPLRVSYFISAFGPGNIIDFDANRYRNNEFPLDYEVWINDLSGSVTDNSMDVSAWSGLRVQFGTQFIIPLSKKK